MPGFDPGCAIGGKASGGDQHMDMGMEEHGARPGVKDRKCADARAQVAGIVGESLQGIGCGFHEQAIDFSGMRSGKGAQFRRQGKGHQKIGTR